MNGSSQEIIKIFSIDNEMVTNGKICKFLSDPLIRHYILALSERLISCFLIRGWPRNWCAK